MKNISLLILLLINILHADTEGIIQKKWVSVPTEIYNETQPLEKQNDGIEEVKLENEVIPARITQYINTTDNVKDTIEIVPDKKIENKIATADQHISPISAEVQKKVEKILENMRKAKKATQSNLISKNLIN